MSVKKLLILAAAGVVSTSAFAGGASNYSAPASMSSDDQVGLYVGVNGGYAQMGWKNQLIGAAGANWQNSAGWTAGADLGYSFNQNLALEFGGYWLPKTNYVVASGPTSFKTWNLYLAGKGTVPLYENIDVFAKVGAAYAHSNTSGTGTAPTNSVAGTNSSVLPMFALGLGYDFAQDWNLNAQYAYFMGKQRTGTVYTPSVSLYTLGVAYTFAM